MDLGRNLLWRKNEEIVSREILRLVLLFNVKYALNLFQFIFLSLALTHFDLKTSFSLKYTVSIIHTLSFLLL